MQTTRFKEAPTKGPLLKSQIVLYTLTTLFSVWFVWSYGSAVWRHRHDPTPQTQYQPGTIRGDLHSIWRAVWFNEPMRIAAPSTSTITSTAGIMSVIQPAQAVPVAPVATAAPVADPAAVSTEGLDAEVARVVPTLPKWMPVALDPAHLAEYSSARMGELEGWKSSTFARDLPDWRTMADVPTLAGHYTVMQAAACDWPVRGSIAVEVRPTEGDPTAQSGPWRAVVFLAAPSGADEAILYRSFLGTAPLNAREIVLGKNAVPAVPVACERVGESGRTFFCVVPAAQVTVRIGGTEVVQHIRPQAAPVAQVQQTEEAWQRDALAKSFATPTPAARATPDPVAARYAAWKSLHDAYVTQIRGRLAAATTDEQKGQIQRDIATWQRVNPEPPKPAAN